MFRPGAGSCAELYRSRLGGWLVAVGLGATLAVAASPTGAQQHTAKIAVAFSLTGPNASIGIPDLDGVRLAVEEANAAGGGPTIELTVHDDTSDIETGKKLAHQIGAGDALLVVGPATTLMALETGRIYSDAGIVNIGPSTTGDEVTEPPNSFRAIASTSDGGGMLASYLRHVLGGRTAIVLYKDDGYGRAAANGFRRAAPGLGITTEYRAFRTVAESEEAARLAAADPANPAIFIAAYDADTVPVLTTLRRQGARGPILGTVTMAGEPYSALFAGQPEERQEPGFFTDGVYAATPVIFDSSNAETLAFADRFRARFGHEPDLWASQGFEAARLAVAAARATASGGGADLRSRRTAIRNYLVSLDRPANGIPGLNGPLWFTAERGRDQALRIGRFHGTQFESAPGQLVPVSNPDPAEIAAGVIVDTGSGRFARRQQVVYAGVYLNEIPRLDIARSRFSADFYVWMRFASGAGAADPTEIDFPDLVRGSSDGMQLAADRLLRDGMTYRLWRMLGDFKSDFDLHHYPTDRQTLEVRFFNAHAASDRIVYVRDRRSLERGADQLPVTAAAARGNGGSALAGEAARPPSAPGPADAFGSTVAPAAFRNLTQWAPVRSSQRRDNLVTESSLGDPDLVGLERIRELSGFVVSVELHRLVLATLVKTLLPLVLMALIMYASLYFPANLVKEKVAVAITAALSGAVLLSSINAQLGGIGYVIAVEYVFYVFFALCLLCIVAVLTAEKFRAAANQPMAIAADRAGRYLFVLGGVGTILAAWLAHLRW
jgi:branched-chain amino acid transport system substrate-binding protein